MIAIHPGENPPLRIIPGGSLSVGAYPLAELNFILTSQELREVISSNTQEFIAIDDVVFHRHTDAVVDKYYEVTVQPDNIPAGFTYTPEIELIGSSGNLSGTIVSRVSDGTVQVRVRIPGLTKSVALNLQRIIEGQQDTFSDFVAGSLAKILYDSCVIPAEGKTSASMPVYSFANHSTPSYIRNTGFWLSNVDITSTSPWNSAANVYWAGALVSPRHIIRAAHAPVSVGTVLRFIGPNNEVVDRTVTNAVSLAGGIDVDTQVAVLDQDVPDYIQFARVFPADLLDYLPTLGVHHIPVVGFDAQEKGIAKHLTGITVRGQGFTFSNVASLPLSNLTESTVGGDSGNPIYAIVGNEAVLISLWTTAQTGPAFHMHLNQINAAMTSLGSEYQLTEVDLSSFTNFGQ